jgi:hypothetical protein
LFAAYTYGKVEIYFYWYQFKPPFESEEKRRQLLTKLNSFLAEKIPDHGISRRPAIALSGLADHRPLEQFFQAFDWFLAEVKAA